MKPSQVPPLDQARFSDWPERAACSHRTVTNLLFRRLIGLKGRLVRAFAREGATAFLMRKGSQAIDRLGERARIGWRGLRPWAADGRPVFLLINHHCGGGTEQHVRDLSTGLSSEGVRVVVVRPSRRGYLLWEERDECSPGAWCRESTVEPGSMKRLLESLEPVHAHVHHVMGVPIELVDLLAEQGVPFDWTIHDFFTICPRVNLINGEHTYCGEPDEAGCNQCLARLGDDQGRPVATSIKSWRDGFARRLGRARRVFVASADSRDRLQRYLPELRVLLRPHPESLPNLESLAAPLVPDEPVRVAVVGTITAVKGAEKLLACADVHAPRQRCLLNSTCDLGRPTVDAVFPTGDVCPRHRTRYKASEQSTRESPRRVCQPLSCPSVSPESFMFTLSIVMTSGAIHRLFRTSVPRRAVCAHGGGVKSWTLPPVPMRSTTIC